jgi:hypothetical protein
MQNWSKHISFIEVLFSLILPNFIDDLEYIKENKYINSLISNQFVRWKDDGIKSLE